MKMNIYKPYGVTAIPNENGEVSSVLIGLEGLEGTLVLISYQTLTHIQLAFIAEKQQLIPPSPAPVAESISDNHVQSETALLNLPPKMEPYIPATKVATGIKRKSLPRSGKRWHDPEDELLHEEVMKAEEEGKFGLRNRRRTWDNIATCLDRSYDSVVTRYSTLVREGKWRQLTEKYYAKKGLIKK